MNDCLILVDVQKGFVSEKTDYVLPRIHELIKTNRFKHIVCTKFLNEPDSPYIRFIGWHKFMPGSSDIRIDDEVLKASELVIEKTTYSALTEEFLNYIENNHIEKVYVAGIDTDCCVLTTAVDLFSHNIPFEVLLYYSASNGGEESHNAAIRGMTRLLGGNNLRNDPL